MYRKNFELKIRLNAHVVGAEFEDHQTDIAGIIDSMIEEVGLDHTLQHFNIDIEDAVIEVIPEADEKE